MSKRKQVTIPIEKIQEQDKYIEQIHRQMKNTSTELERENSCLLKPSGVK